MVSIFRILNRVFTFHFPTLNQANQIMQCAYYPCSRLRLVLISDYAMRLLPMQQVKAGSHIRLCNALITQQVKAGSHSSANKELQAGLSGTNMSRFLLEIVTCLCCELNPVLPNLQDCS